MISTCPKCGCHEWNKEVVGNRIICPRCREEWNYIKKPLYILTGCSGIGKTTTALKLQKLTTDFVILDADLFYNIMPHETDADYFALVEQVESLSVDIMQCYNYRFFSDVYVLALVCSGISLRMRMTEGRHITSEEWINSSLEYNTFFKTHKQIGEVRFETLDIEGKDVDEAAQAVLQWLKEH